MKPTELKIGDYVKYQGHIYIVEEISAKGWVHLIYPKTKIRVNMTSDYIIDLLEPISLSPINYEQKYKEALEKARKLCAYPTSKPFISDLQDFFPELKESSEYESVRKELINFVKSRLAGFPQCEKYITWLEAIKEKVDDANKIKSKFKVGDWVVYNNKHQSIYQVEKIENGYYILRHTGGGTFRTCVLHDEGLRLWTFSDAEEGDVLAGKIDGDSYILIYRQIKDGWIETYGHYYDSVNRFCVPSQLFCRDVKGIFHPATKKQRELLFTKIKEADYMWDDYKKELIKL